MKHYIRTLFLLCAVLALYSCHGGSAGGLLPHTNSLRTRSATVTQPSVSQWGSGAPYAPASVTVSMPAAPVTGDVLLVALWNNGQANGAANTYTAPTGWSLVDQNTSHAYATYQVFLHVVGSGETNSYAFTPLSPVRQHSWIAADVINAINVDTNGAGNTWVSGTAWTPPSVTPVQSSDLAVAFNLPLSLSAVTWTNPSGWTLGTGPTAPWHGETIDQALSSTSPVSETTTSSASVTGFASVVLLTASGAPPPTPPPPTPPPPTPPPGGGTPASVAQWSSGAPYAPASILVAFPTAPHVGDLLFVTFWNNGQSTGAANTYTPPAGWTLVDQNTANAYATYQSFAHTVGTGENNSYAFVPASAARQHAWIGADIINNSGVEKAANAFVSSSATYASPSITPSHSNDLALVFDLPFKLGSATWTNPAGWTNGIGPTVTWPGQGIFQSLASLSTVSETSTLSSAATGFAAVALITPSNVPVTPSPAPAYTDWNTFGDDLHRTGYNPNETTLTATTLAASPLKQVWATDLGGAITAQPILATNVNVSGTPTNVLYIGSENNTFYAVNADTGSVVWNRSLGAPLATTCTDLPSKQFGITSTATYDRASGLVYVADAGDNIDALDMTTGALQWSVNILQDPNTNTTVGSATQDHIYTALTYNPSNGMLYAGTASFCDQIPWHGRVVAVNTATHTVAAAFFPGRTTGGKTGTAYCGGGFWGMGGVSIDAATNDVYVATGNVVTTTTGGCTADPNGETYPYGDSVVQLDSQLNYISSDPANVNGTKASNDSDYGATAMLYSVPNCTSLQLSAKNKNGFVYTYAAASTLSAEQQLHVGNTTSAGEFVGVPAFDPVTNMVYVGNPNANGNYAHGLNALSQSGGCSGLTLAWKASIGSSNVTSDDNQAPTVANGVVYFTDGLDNKVWAFNASTGAQLWNSGTTIGSPCSGYGLACGVLGAATVDGRVFVGSWNHKLYAFGL